MTKTDQGIKTDSNKKSVKLHVDFNCILCTPTLEYFIRKSDDSGVKILSCDFNAGTNPKSVTISTNSDYSGNLEAYFTEKINGAGLDYNARSASKRTDDTTHQENAAEQGSVPSNVKFNNPHTTSSDAGAPPAAKSKKTSTPEATNGSATTDESSKDTSSGGSYKTFWHVLQGIFGIAFGISIAVPIFMDVVIPATVMYGIAAGSTLVTLALGWESYSNAFSQLFYARTLSMDSLFALSSIAALGISFGNFYYPDLPIMFDAAVMIFGFKHIGDAVKESCNQHISDSLSYQSLAKKAVTKIVDSKETICNVADLKIGDVISVNPGEYLPANATYLGAAGNIKNTVHTGNLSDITIKQNSEQKAGIKVSGQQALQFKVTKLAKDSELAKLDKLLEAAETQESNREKSSRNMLQYFIPGVILFAAVTGSLAVFYISPTMGIYTALTVLTSACPCALGAAVPGTLALGMQKARELGVDFKSTKDLETAAEVDTVVFDLNGTLTKGTPCVKDFESTLTDPAAEKALLGYIFDLEKDSTHSTAQAIKTYCMSKHLTQGAELANKSDPQSGREATINGKEYIIGNAELMRMKRIAIPTTQFGKVAYPHVIYVAKDNNIIARFQVDDQLRQDAKKIVNALQDKNKKVHLCTGASTETANAYANTLGIDTSLIRANCSPKQKQEFIKELQDDGKTVAMVGDAENDTLPLAQSDLGIAVKSSSKLTANKANAVINKDSLQPILNAFVVAEETVSTADTILYTSIGYNLLVLGVVGFALPGFGLMAPPGLCYGFMIVQGMFLTYMAFGVNDITVPSIDSEGSEETSSSSYEKMFDNDLKPEAKNTHTATNEQTAGPSMYEWVSSLFFTPVDPEAPSDSSSPTTDTSSDTTPQPSTFEWLGSFFYSNSAEQAPNEETPSYTPTT